jgi:hypothetical protein
MRILIVLALLGTVSAARANEEEDVAAARLHFRKGGKAYDLGRYLEAAKEYEAAYDAKDDPALLFNIAQAYRLGGDNPNAVRAYKAFLRRMPRAPNRAEVEARIAELQHVIEQQAHAKESAPEGTMAPSTKPPDKEPAAAPTAPVSSGPEKPPVYKRWWFWTAIGGVVVVGVALGVGLGVGLRSGDDFQSTLRDVGPGTSGALTVGFGR